MNCETVLCTSGVSSVCSDALGKPTAEKQSPAQSFQSQTQVRVRHVCGESLMMSYCDRVHRDVLVWCMNLVEILTQLAVHGYQGWQAQTCRLHIAPSGV